MMRIRDRIFRKLKKNNNQSLTDLYKQFRNRVTVAMKEVKPAISITTFKRTVTT